MARGGAGRTVRRTALRWLFLTHRWVGIGACLLFAMWFGSGLVMLYVPYPSLSPAARWGGAVAIDWAKVDAPVPAVAGRQRLTLEMRDVEPVWRIEGDAIETRAARLGAVLPVVDRAYAERLAARFAGVPVASGHARDVERIVRDQWTVAGGFDRHRPLWKVTLGDAAGTELYVSSTSGLPVQRTTRSQRFWNWIGSVPHWLYPTILRQDNAAWRQVVMWVAGPCIAVALSGIWIGIVRARFGKRRYRAGRVSPYRGWMLWHHVSGLIGGLSLLTWIVSGWLSVDPGRLFAGTGVPDDALRRYRALDRIGDIAIGRLAVVAQAARTVEITNDAGVARISIDRASDHPRFFEARTLVAAGEDRRAIAGAVRALVPDGRLVRIGRLHAPDAYWGETRPLPVLRLRFDDPARSWLYIDPRTGEFVERQDRSRRLYRWAFDLLHTWDWLWLVERQPLRDLLIWLASLIGLVLSVSGVWIGYRRLVRR